MLNYCIVCDGQMYSDLRFEPSRKWTCSPQCFKVYRSSPEKYRRLCVQKERYRTTNQIAKWKQQELRRLPPPAKPRFLDIFIPMLQRRSK